jgi:hypothetical protein
MKELSGRKSNDARILFKVILGSKRVTHKKAREMVNNTVWVAEDCQ